MNKMRWLVTLVVLSVCVYCTIAHEPQQGRIEYDDSVMLVDHQAERDDDRLAEDGVTDHAGEDQLIEDGLIEHDDDDDGNDDEDMQAELQSTVNSWNTVPRKYGSTPILFLHISTSINYFWGTDRNNKVYRCARPCTGNWVRVAAVGGLKQVDVSDMEVWGVSSANRVCKRPADGSGTWTEVKGQQLIHVSASGNGYIWGVSSSRYVYRCKKPCSGSWIRVYYSYNFKQVDGGEEYVFGVTTTNKVYRYPINGRNYGRWTFIPGKFMKYVSVGANDVFGVEASTSKVYRCALPCSGSWKIVNTCQNMRQVEATVGKIVGTSIDNRVFKTRV